MRCLDYKVSMPTIPREKLTPDEREELEREQHPVNDDDEDLRYYYDDAHGYRDYDPESDDDEFDD